MNVTITQLPVAGPITGTELVPVVQDGQTRQSTAAAIAASPAQFQTFLTLNQEPTLANSRRLTAGTGLGLADGGALSTLALSLNGASGSLETALTGIVAKTGSVTVVARTLTASGLGLSITNGSGVAGNPTFALTGQVADLANLSSPGILASNGSGLNPRVLLGTAGEIDVTNGTGSAGNPTVGLADNPVVPGVASMVLPQGTTAQRAAPGFGAIRYNIETKNIEAYTELIGWGAIISGSGVSTFSAGATGLLPSTPQTGNIVLSGVLAPANGGTGVSNSHTITLGGAVSTAGAFTTSGAAMTLTATGATNVTLPTTGTLATLAGSEVLTNKSISGATNTLSNIGNSSLTNSSLTYNGVTVSLGGSGTITAANPQALTIGTGLSGTSYNGSLAVTIAIDSTVVTLSGSQTLTNKTLTSPVIATIVNSGTLTLPTTTDTLVGRATSDTLTNKSISGSTNTLTNIGNSSLTNSSVTFNGTTVALGASGTITANTTNALTVGTGLQLDSGTTFNGSAARTISLTSPVAVSLGGTGLTAGTSGGVLYYSAAGTLASSAVLAASALVVGGGAGLAPSTITTGAGVVTALGVNTGTAGAFVVNGGALGTPSSGTLTNATGLPVSTGLSGLGTGVATALAVNTGSAGAVVVNGGALGTPSSGTATNLTGLPLTTGVTGTLPVANGGTGLTSYAVGDITYASAATTLTKLPLGTAGQVLVAGASAPKWDTVNGGTF